jgi:hypothetical protein
MEQITHATTPTEVVKLADLADETVVAACDNCRTLIEVGLDDYGYWVVCDCTVGYVDGDAIHAIVMW